jgi:hypothetical protein
MTVLFADQVGLWNEENKAEFIVRRTGDKALEGTRVLAINENDAKEVYLKMHSAIIDAKVKE